MDWKICCLLRSYTCSNIYALTNSVNKFSSSSTAWFRFGFGAIFFLARLTNISSCWQQQQQQLDLPRFCVLFVLWGNNFWEREEFQLIVWLCSVFCFWFLVILSYRLPIWLNNRYLDGRNLDNCRPNLLFPVRWGSYFMSYTKNGRDIPICKWTLMGNWCSYLLVREIRAGSLSRC